MRFPGLACAGARRLEVDLQKGSVATPADRTTFSTHRIHCGFQQQRSSGEAHSALRGWRPIPAALLAPSLIQLPEQETFPFYYRDKIPLTKR